MPLKVCPTARHTMVIIGPGSRPTRIYNKRMERYNFFRAICTFRMPYVRSLFYFQDVDEPVLDAYALFIFNNINEKERDYEELKM